MDTTNTDSKQLARLPAIVTTRPAAEDGMDRVLSELTAAIRALDNSLSLSRKNASNTDKSPAKSVDGEWEEVRPGKDIVYLRVVYLKLGEIDTLKENYTASVFINVRWREPRLDSANPEGVTSINPEDYWNPKIVVENVLGDPKEIKWHKVDWDENGQAFISEKHRIKASFMEKMELTDFPCDTQELAVSIISERSSEEVTFEEDRSVVSRVHNQSFADEQEWHLHDHVEFEAINPQENEYQNAKYRRPGMKAMCRATRKPGYFIWNVVLIMFFIIGMSFLTFTVDPNKPQNRIQLTFILILSMVTFKFVVSNSLPKISYLTYLDKYILVSFSFLCLICIWHGIVPSFAKQWAADQYFLATIASVFALYHILFFIVIYVPTHRQLNQNRTKDRVYWENVEEQMAKNGQKLEAASKKAVNKRRKEMRRATQVSPV